MRHAALVALCGFLMSSCSKAPTAAKSRAALLKSYTDFSASTYPCDSAMKGVSNIANDIHNDDDVTDAYSRVKNAESACQQAAFKARYPDVADNLPSEYNMEDVRATCADAYSHEEQALSTYMEVLAGKGSPSKISAIRDALADVPDKQAACENGWKVAARKLGVTLPA